MSKSQVNFRLPDTLIAALKQRADSEGLTSTELAIRLLETGLGVPPSEVSELDPRIAKRIEERLMSLLSVLHEQIDQGIATRIATQLAPLQERLEERIERRIHEVIRGEVDTMLGESRALGKRLDSQVNDRLKILEAGLAEVRSQPIPAPILEAVEEVKEQQDILVKTELPPGMAPLLQVGLASRLGVNESTLWRARQSNNFADWCRSRDPDGIGWEYRPVKKRVPQYYPIP